MFFFWVLAYLDVQFRYFERRPRVGVPMPNTAAQAERGQALAFNSTASREDVWVDAEYLCMGFIKQQGAEGRRDNFFNKKTT